MGKNFLKFKSRIPLFIVMVFIIFLGYGQILIWAFDNEIFYLKRSDFINFLEDHKEWEKYFDNLELDPSLWNCDFFCWDKEKREFVIPHIPSDKRGIKRELADALYDYYKKNVTKLKDFLISRDEMALISLLSVMKNKYDYVSWVKDCCFTREEEIDFYIIDLPGSDENDSRVKVYSCCKDVYNRIRLLPALKDINDPGCVKFLEEILNSLDKKEKNPSFKIKIGSIICSESGNKSIIEPISKKSLSSGNVIAIPSKKGEGDDFFKIDRLEYGKVPSITFVIDLSKKDCVGIIQNGGIFLGNSENKGNRIINSSLYSEILNHYDKTSRESRIEHNTIELFYARTSNFCKGSPKEDEKDIKIEIKKKEKELEAILIFLKDIIYRQRTKAFVEIIGYADISGLGNKDWKTMNKRLAELRSKEVKKWFFNKLGNLNRRIKKLEYKSCDEKYFERDYRGVEIKIYL